MKQLLKYCAEENTSCTVEQDRDMLQRYCIDGHSPEYVILPKNTQEVSEVMRAADKSETSVITWGGGTKVQFGSYVTSYSTALDITGINGISEYDPSELIVCAKAGTTIDELNRELLKNNQFVPLNPPFSGKATVGGVLASNAWGYFREQYGTARDITLGMEFIRADGRKIKTGGKVSKNAAGYDIKKLMIGSWGTLGIITEAVLRVHPLPENRTTLITGFSDLSDCADFIFALYDTHCAPSFLVLINRCFAENTYLNKQIDILRSMPYWCIIGYDGLADTVRWQHTAFGEFCRNHSAEYQLLKNTASENVRTVIQNYCGVINGVLCRIVSTRTGLFKILEYVNKLQRKSFIETVTYFSSGISLIALPYLDEKNEIEKKVVLDKTAQLEHFVRMDEGYSIVEYAPVWFKMRFPARQPFPGEQVMKRIKKQLDPSNILNPGRYISL